MKLVGVAFGMFLGASLLACGAGSNGGWVTKGGWDKASRAPAPNTTATAEPSDIPLSALDLENPYLKPAAKNAMGDKSAPKSMVDESPYAAPAAGDTSKAKTEKKPLKGDEAGF